MLHHEFTTRLFLDLGVGDGIIRMSFGIPVQSNLDAQQGFFHPSAPGILPIFQYKNQLESDLVWELGVNHLFKPLLHLYARKIISRLANKTGISASIYDVDIFRVILKGEYYVY